ncbi:putative GTP cyclohydrolase I [Venustampulla echinocandica]|uniref:GTP cyclohydrolase 1 n=1 Tax=Venustampulla echinocandica TaxID=2656787 RepID=A0A370TTC0_9HELO|nr:putative GTP cyclohydrolase I [Venustampulla echinocandica]RDL38777.1 putative GTP cyclohydrolase I [Venustampulla echinocandica]
MVEFANLPVQGNKENQNEDIAGMSNSSSTSSDQETLNAASKRRSADEAQEWVGAKRKRKSKSKPEKGLKTKVNGKSSKRRLSVSKPARDPRDEASPPRPPKGPDEPRSPSPVINFDGLSRPSRGTRERKEETPEQAVIRMERLSGAVRTILECIGEDPDREGLLGTPERYAKAMLFFTKGYQENVRDIVNDAIFHEGHNELVIVKDIEVFSLCEHHMVPFTGKMHIGYIPDRNVIGISKLPRIADMFSRRLQIQERLTKDVAHAIMEVLKPQGVAVVMESSHLCMVMRGVEKTSATTITSCVLGCIEKREKTRNEFFSLVGLNRR